jgi:hypothetical protein
MDLQNLCEVIHLQVLIIAAERVITLWPDLLG